MELNRMYKCSDCGAVFEVVESCTCDDSCKIACCGKDATPLKENTVDAAKEKHIPVIEKVPGGYKVTIGSVLHPMTQEHHIVLIELIADGQVLRQNLDPTGKPEAIFLTNAQKVKAREYCNLHGLWTSQN